MDATVCNPGILQRSPWIARDRSRLQIPSTVLLSSAKPDPGKSKQNEALGGFILSRHSDLSKPQHFPGDLGQSPRAKCQS